MTVQTGMHSCWHAHPEGEFSAHIHEINSSMIENHATSLERLMKAVRTAVERPTNASASTMVIVVTSGSVGMAKGDNINNCILRFNRLAAAAAHAQGFAVLERGEIERRLLFKSIGTKGPFEHETHLTQPAQNIIATTLLSMMTCLDQVPPPNAKKFAEFHSRGNLMKPLHSPP